MGSMGVLLSRKHGRRCPLRGRHQVGRDRRPSDLWLQGDHISARHAELQWSDIAEQWSVRDLHSKNHTLVEGRAIEPGMEVALAEGASISFGSAESTWELISTDAPSAFAASADGLGVVEVAEGVLELPSPEQPEVVIYRASRG